ncbi:MAG: glycosyltransferase family 2 protein [Candidatus Thermoplasmatota archaeon]|nr:glycosyltransferase family 2 protein [Candidatus Thermoplasmatota archaeon]
MITAIIPAYNEEKRIEKVLEETSQYVDEIIVVDDNSTDSTAEIARGYGRTIEKDSNQGYIDSIRRGFEAAEGDIVVTLDADGEHDPSYIPELVTPIEEDRADLVFGRRKKIPRISERVISWMTGLRVGVKDPGIGFRALKTSLAKRLELKGYCTCGTFALEAHFKGARISEISTPVREVEKPKHIAWQHFFQFFVVLRMLF